MKIFIKDGSGAYEQELSRYADLEKAVLYVIQTRFKGEVFVSTTMGTVNVPCWTPFDRLSLPERLIKESWGDNSFDNSRVDK